MYDINSIKDRLKSLRKDRWKQFKEHERDSVNPYGKYACCKSQYRLAEEIGVERRTIISWEKGDSIPSIDCLINLCNILDCSVDYLLGSGDIPEIDPISKASHHSGISPVIIRYGLEHNDYLDCLNYFMLPENCSTLFNEVTLSTWKKYWINSNLVDIKSPLKEDIIKLFNEYNAVTPFGDINKQSYRLFLESKLPQNKLILSSELNGNGIKIKGYIKPIVYQNFFTNKEFNYSSFIEYLVDYTFEPLSQNSLIELQKAKLSNAFANLFTNYLEEMD